MLSKRAYLVSEGKMEIREEELTINSRQVLVKIKLCGLCNWELNFWKGTAENFRNYPIVLGHEWAGVVVEKGSEVTNLEIGDKVTVPEGFGGFGEYNVIDADRCYKLQEDVEFDNAIGEPLKCIATVISAAAPRIGDFGLMMGCGPMGFWCLQALAGKLLGGCIAVDIDDKKLQMAKEYGATHTINSARENVQERIREITKGAMCDFVIEGTGIPRLLNQCIYYLKNGGRLVLMSSHESACDSFDFRPAIERGITLFVAHPSSSKSQDDDMKRAIALINNGTFHNEAIISHRFKLEDINKAFETLEHKPKDYIKGIIEF